MITAHKLRLYRACATDLASIDRMVDLSREINKVATDDRRRAAAYANDARSLAAILDSFSGRRIVCLGAGGAATALLLALHLDVDTGPCAARHGVRRRRPGRAHPAAGHRRPDRRPAHDGASDRAGRRFAVFEQPHLFADELRTFFRLVR